jgi:hypothetical protein
MAYLLSLPFTRMLLAKADSQIARYYSVDNPAYRNEKFMTDAHSKLTEAEPKLAEIIESFEQIEAGRAT